jgi:hypothetical protein
MVFKNENLMAYLNLFEKNKHLVVLKGVDSKIIINAINIVRNKKGGI